MQTLRIDHSTEYRFGKQVTLLPHRISVRPRESHSLRVVSSTLIIQPEPRVRWVRDVLDNSIALVSFSAASDQLSIASTVCIEQYDDAPLDFFVEDYALLCPFSYTPEDSKLLAPFLAAWAPGDQGAVHAFLEGLGLLARSMETFGFLDNLNLALHRSFRQQAREQPGVWRPGKTLACAAGACRDLAALFMEACRYRGIASRFVSGYLHATSSETGHGSTHAWAEVYLPGAGWKGFDPTLGEVTGNRHVPVAVAVDPEAVPPVAGSFLGLAGLSTSMKVQVRVQRG
jgi:transglutaminase-like putative cysteine protease